MSTQVPVRYREETDISRLTGKKLCDVATDVRKLHSKYTRHPHEGDVSRVLCGYLTGRFRKIPTREYPQNYVNHKGDQIQGQIDFLLGSKSAGTFIELAILREGDQWSFKPKYSSDLWKLERSGGIQSKRVHLIIDFRHNKHLTKDAMVKVYREGWRTTRGKYKRHHVTIVYASASDTFTFSLKPKKKRPRS